MPDANEDLLPPIINDIFIRQALRPITYTRDYYYWKKFKGVFGLFQREIALKNDPLKIIEVGCGLGNNIFLLNDKFGKDRGLEFLGVDIDSVSLAYCDMKKNQYQTMNISFQKDDMTASHLSSASFDILLALDVLEHLKEPELAIKESLRLLKPNGLMIISTPNKSSVALRLIKSLKRTPSIQETNDIHISVKSLNEWINIFTKYNFKIERIARGSLLCGSYAQDKLRVVFAISLFMEIILDRLPILRNFSEDVIFSARKIC